MKLSVRIPDDDVDFIDRYAAAHDVDSRSAVAQRAVAALRAAELGDDYAAAWAEWDGSEAAVWDTAVDDGLG